MISCPHCGNHYRQLATHLRVAHGITDTTPEPDTVPSITVTFTDREHAALEQIAKRQNITVPAVVRAMVQRIISTGPPAPRTPPPVSKAPKRTGYPAQRRPQPRPSARAEVVTNADGRRICPGCLTILVKKNPHGPGRYPKYCETCR